MRSYGKSILRLEISNLVALLIKHSKHAKRLSKQNKNLRIEKLQLKQQIEDLEEEIDNLNYEIDNTHRYYSYDEDDIGYN